MIKREREKVKRKKIYYRTASYAVSCVSFPRRRESRLSFQFKKRIF